VRRCRWGSGGWAHEAGRRFILVDITQLVDGDAWSPWFLWSMQSGMVMDAQIMSSHCMRVGLEGSMHWRWAVRGWGTMQGCHEGHFAHVYIQKSRPCLQLLCKTQPRLRTMKVCSILFLWSLSCVDITMLLLL